MESPETLPTDRQGIERKRGGLAALLDSRTFDSLQVRDFRWLWLSSTAGFMAMQMQMVARGWLIYDLTDSPMALAWVMVSFALPMSVFTLVGGAITDRVPKRNLLGITMFGSALITLAIALLIHSGRITFTHLLIAGFFNGLVISFQMPGRFSFIPQVVGEERLVNAIALNTTGMNLTRVLAPAAAGVLIGVIGAAGVFDIMVVCYVFGALAVFMMHHRGEPVSQSHRSVGFDIKDGLNYIFRRNTRVLALLILAFFPLLFGMSYIFLMPAFAVEALGMGAEGLGVLMAITGVGAIIGSLAVAYLSNFKHLGALLFGATFVWGISLALFSLSTSLAIAIVPLALVGLSSAIYMSINMSLTQLYASPEMRGRVMSVFMWSFSMMPLGLLPVSAFAEHIGTPTALLASAVLLVVSISLAFLLLPALRHLSAATSDQESIAPATGYASGVQKASD